MPRRPGLHLVVFLSGIAGLGYQVLWVRMLSTTLGHEVFAVLAILAAFFGGLAIGALALDRRIARTRRPALWYAGLEAGIGLWAIALIWLIPAVQDGLTGAIGPEPSEPWRWSVTFGATLCLLLPATLAMGATLPAAERILAGMTGSVHGVGGLYAANTAGAMAGALGTMLLIAPLIGFANTLLSFAMLNGLSAIWALWVSRDARRSATDTEPSPRPVPDGRLLGTLFATGFLGIGFEVAAVRALAQILENTVYAFAAALAVYLFGSALGAALRQRRPFRALGPEALALGLAIASLAGTFGVYAVEPVYNRIREILGPEMYSALAGELAGSAMVLLLPSLAAGALFAELAQRARKPEGGLGAALAANMLGAALAPIGVGLVLIPGIGVVPSLCLLSAAYLVLLLWRPARRHLVLWVPVPVAALALGVLAPSLITPPPGATILREIPGIAATVNVTEEPSGHRWLRVNNSLVMGGTASYKLDRLQGHAILMQHPRPRQALFLGVGTGATLAAAAVHPGLEATGVELLPAVLDTITDFTEAEAEITAAGSRLHLTVADARRWVRADPARYDVIIADTYHPAKDGVAMLYTAEHFRAIRARLADGGIFAQWLPLHQFDLPSLRTVIRTFQTVYPDARLQVGNFNLTTPLLVLIGQREGKLPRLADALGDRVTPKLARALERAGLGTPFALYGGFLGGPEALARFAGPGPLNTDDLPHIMFEAPRSVYTPMDPPIKRLRMIMRAMVTNPGDAVSLAGVSGSDAFATRLARYWDARTEFLRLGVTVRLTGDPLKDAQRLAPELVGILRTSPDFEPAYQPVLEMARQLAQAEPQAARTLLAALERASPGRTEAVQLRRELFGG